ncbi:Flagellar biosynthesis protein, FliO [Rubripirellula tenax]|uniref:Flagellar biosynthesis protein, FliO n=1 Tax=Rubripirellula tenax TaxID=2528015 RepID=A0A5C6ERU1_9BACT|nr:flagellar biosynthetic protein FliO [Rubripirellula tenax]TWU50807.1 Flagellar biosynthesis protein, FliO [Rubripirellula tenax]
MLTRHIFCWLSAMAILVTADGAAQEFDTASVYQRPSAMAIDDEVTPQAKIARPGNFPAFQVREHASDALVETAEPSKNQFAIPAITVTSSLAVVLGLFAAMVWVTRKYGSRSIAPGAIPREVMEHLGSSAIDPRTRLTMIRCGARILVLSQTATEVRPLAEITDAEEVRRLTAACLGDSKRNFADAIESIEKEKPQPGFAGELGTSFDAPRQRGRLFTTTG